MIALNPYQAGDQSIPNRPYKEDVLGHKSRSSSLNSESEDQLSINKHSAIYQEINVRSLQVNAMKKSHGPNGLAYVNKDHG